jgi:hypothetical protein
MGTRELYRTLIQHYVYANCPLCTCFKEYGVMIVKTDLIRHIEDIVNISNLKRSAINIDIKDFSLLSDFVKVQKIVTDVYCITFVLLT